MPTAESDQPLYTAWGFARLRSRARSRGPTDLSVNFIKSVLPPTGSLNRPRRPLSQGFGPAGYPTKPPVSYQIKSTTIRVDPSSTGDSRRRGARQNPGQNREQAGWLEWNTRRKTRFCGRLAPHAAPACPGFCPCYQQSPPPFAGEAVAAKRMQGGGLCPMIQFKIILL